MASGLVITHGKNPPDEKDPPATNRFAPKVMQAALPEVMFGDVFHLDPNASVASSGRQTNPPLVTAS